MDLPSTWPLQILGMNILVIVQAVGNILVIVQAVGNILVIVPGVSNILVIVQALGNILVIVQAVGNILVIVQAAANTISHCSGCSGHRSNQYGLYPSRRPALVAPAWALMIASPVMLAVGVADGPGGTPIVMLPRP